MKRKRIDDSNVDSSKFKNGNESLQCSQPSIKSNSQSNKPKIITKFMISSDDDSNRKKIEFVKNMKQSNKEKSIYTDKNSIWQDEFLAQIDQDDSDEVNETPKFKKQVNLHMNINPNLNNDSFINSNERWPNSSIKSSNHLRFHSENEDNYNEDKKNKSDEESFRKKSYKNYMSRNK